MTPLQEVRYGYHRPYNRGCWLCDNYLMVDAGEGDWKKAKKKTCVMTGKILSTMRMCPLADAARVE